MQTANTTAIVTGGASGLGAATAAALAAAGSHVVALDLPPLRGGPAVEGALRCGRCHQRGRCRRPSHGRRAGWRPYDSRSTVLASPRGTHPLP